MMSKDGGINADKSIFKIILEAETLHWQERDAAEALKLNYTLFFYCRVLGWGCFSCARYPCRLVSYARGTPVNRSETRRRRANPTIRSESELAT